MEMNERQLKDLYDAVVKTSGHPDPVGFMARIMITSQGDPDYLDAGGLMGIMPVNPDRAIAMVGATEVQSLQGNLTATLAMDSLIFQDTLNLEAMVVTFHEFDGDDIWAELDEARSVVREFLFPRLATIKDVIEMFDQADGTEISEDQKVFFANLAGIVS